MTKTIRNLGGAVCAALVLLSTNPVAADATLRVGDDLKIDSTSTQPAPAGGCTRVRLRLVNDGTNDVHLLGGSSAVAERARLVARIDPVNAVTLPSIAIPAQETLDLDSSHLWFELCGLNRPLATGDSFTLTVEFVGWRADVDVDVH